MTKEKSTKKTQEIVSEFVLKFKGVDDENYSYLCL